MTMREAPMASGASAPAPGAITVLPTVKTRKNVPMNSTRYVFIGLPGVDYGPGRGSNERFFVVAGRAYWASLRIPMRLHIPEGDVSGYILDLDGTLVDTMPLHYAAWEAAL